MGLITGTTPKKDGYRMPAEFEPQERIWMLWPERPDNWRDRALPAQEAYAAVARAIAEFEPVVIGVSSEYYEEAAERFSKDKRITVSPMPHDDAWIRDTGPTFLVNDKGNLRAADWKFNAYGGHYDGLYDPWDLDDALAGNICSRIGIDRYRADFVLEGGSIHTDGQGTILTTEMCLLSQGRNPSMSKEDIEDALKKYLGGEKVIWIPDGIDPDETNGHVDDVCCFTAPGEVACIYTDDTEDPSYEAAQKAFDMLSHATDAKGRKIKVHPICMPKEPVRIGSGFYYEPSEGCIPRKAGDYCAASYINFLIVNGGIIVPQYGDENDARALNELQALFPDRRAVGVPTREVVYGGGNIHCITQQQPKV
ncbi:MAG: agmatine deiminase [Eubacterium sp.]|nr:agmatine deiminase [Eubacterium sp.]